MPTYYELKTQQYEKWIEKLNKITNRELGLDLDDLEDAPTRDSFDNGETPREAFQNFCTEYWNIDSEVDE